MSDIEYSVMTSDVIKSFDCIHNICEKLVGTRVGGGMISHSPKCDIWASPNISIWIFGVLS